MVDPGKYDFDFTGKVLLVVEDNQISFRLISAVLSKVNLGIVHASTGRKAVEICKSDQPLDLVLMDLQLPELSGLEATRQIKRIRPDLHVIATTADTFDEDEAASRAAGASAYVTKPLQFKKLFELIQSFFDQKK
jgi:CheY-like chemotaxis protein